MELKKCPVCNKKFVKQGLVNHIINSAKAEAYKCLWNMLICSRNKPYQFSPMVLRKQAVHLNYMLKNYKLTNRRKLKI